MQRLWRIVSTIALILLGVALAPPAQAADDHPTWRIQRYEQKVTLDRSGTAAVTLDLYFDFGNDAGRGPYLWFVQRQAVAGDPDHWRMIDVHVTSVTSTTGASTEIKEDTEDGNLVLRIGSENRKDRRGVQHYVIQYTARGLVEPQASSGLDEFNWNAVGSGWDVPMDAVRVEVTGPAAVQQTACFQGSRLDRPCTASQPGATVVYAAGPLAKGEAVQVVAGYPAGTFVGAEPQYTKRYHPGNLFEVTPVSLGVTGGLTAAGVLAVLLVAGRRRDEAYLGQVPGLAPLGTQPTRIGRAHAAEVAVRFTPPDGARPGEIGTLYDGSADHVDVSATLIDLAVRGHLRITELDKKTWQFERLRTRDERTPPEDHLLTSLFGLRPSVTSDELTPEASQAAFGGTRTALDKRVTADLHWFASRPSFSRGVAIAAGIALILAGLAAGAILAVTVGLGLVGIAPVVAGVVLVALNRRFVHRTADGTAVLAQARGFELYLTTAEADQIRFEESVDVFSRYLPYAIVFGVAERWTAIFEKLAAEGRYQPDTTWYVGPHGGVFYAAGFADSLGHLGSDLGASMASMAAPAAGGSGFSGGGGFGGGGGGGW